jgi:hypothetical protein
MIFPFFNFSDIFKFPQDIRQDIRQNYDLRREHATSNSKYRNTLLTAPLEQSLANLNQIEGRVESRIAKDESSGIDMTTANLLFVSARDLLDNAAQAVAEATSTASNNGLNPIYVRAHFALNGARDALSAVVDSLGADTASSTVNTTN